jgi:hypothetical protein
MDCVTGMTFTFPITTYVIVLRLRFDKRLVNVEIRSRLSVTSDKNLPKWFYPGLFGIEAAGGSG